MQALSEGLITMARGEARVKVAEYLKSVRERHSAEDEQILRGYRALARGMQVINLRTVLAAGGVFEETGLPKLAVAQADTEWVYCERESDGRVTFAATHSFRRRSTQRKGIFRFPAGTLSTWVGTQPPWGTWRDMRAMVPIVPPGLRPNHSLANYCTLFEVPRWEKVPRPPGDPALLRHIGGELYAVIAIWDLTPLEQAVLAGRMVQ